MGDSVLNPNRGYEYHISDATYTHPPGENGGIGQIRPILSRD